MFHACKFDNCQLIFDKPFKLKQHEDWHMGIKTFVCNEKGCSKSYCTSSHLKRHLKTSHGPKNKLCDVVYVCSFSNCKATFQTSSGLQKHEGKHLLGLACNICHQFFRDREHLVQHQIKRHRQSSLLPKLELNGSYFCEECLITFARKNDFNLHCKTSHEPLSFTFYCGEPDCQKSFRHKKNLKEHILRCHLGGSVFICGENDCVKVFRYKRNLRKHIQTNHLNIYLCCPVENCCRTFRFKKSLKFHIRQHQNNLVKKRIKLPKQPVDLAKKISYSIVGF